MSMLTLYTNPMSRGRITRWMLEEVAQPYEVRVLGFGEPMRTPEFLRLNPMGKVPVLVDDGQVLSEVAAICVWLAERFPEAGLAPAPGTPARAAYLRWLFFIAGPLELAMTALNQGWRIDADNRIAVGCGLPQETLALIRQQLEQGGWLCGEQFTVPDLLLASYLGWGMRLQQLEAEPLFVDYVARADARPAARRAEALDNALAGA
jgi:glutathione S-transferase